MIHSLFPTFLSIDRKLELTPFPCTHATSVRTPPPHMAPTLDVVVAGVVVGAALFLSVFVFLWRRDGIAGRVLVSERHGGELVAEVIRQHGVKFVFTLSGGHISPVLVGCQDLGIRVIDVRHEVTTVFAADAVARLTGGVGVAIVTSGPGVTNTVTAVQNAKMAQSPVVLIGGAAATVLKGRGSLQDIDQVRAFWVAGGGRRGRRKGGRESAEGGGEQGVQRLCVCVCVCVCVLVY